MVLVQLSVKNQLNIPYILLKTEKSRNILYKQIHCYLTKLIQLRSFKVLNKLLSDAICFFFTFISSQSVDFSVYKETSTEP